jgi:glycosyltransferase involved in cell wall biosynthesis
MNNQRILIVSAFDITGTGGVINAIRALRKELSGLGHDVSVLVPADNNRVTKLAAADGFRRFGMNMRVPFIKNHRTKSVISFLLHAPLTIGSLLRFVKRNGINVIMVQYPLPWMFYLGIVRRLAGCRLIVTYQGNDAHDLLTWSRLDRQMIGSLLRNADEIVAVSPTLADIVCTTIAGLQREQIHVIPNGAVECGLRTPAITNLPTDFIVTVGQLVHRKGMDTLIKAMYMAVARGCTSSLVIVGDGPDRQALEEQAQAAGLKGQVLFVGAFSQKDSLSIVQHSRFFVLASRAEGLPLAIVEAMSCRKAIVATHVDGVPDVVLPDRTGLLVPPDDPAALADAILALDSDDALRNRLADGALEHFRRGFTWHSIAQRYSEFFDSVTPSD